MLAVKVGNQPALCFIHFFFSADVFLNRFCCGGGENTIIQFQLNPAIIV